MNLLFYFFCIFFIFIVNAKLEIRDANVATLSRDDIGMIFYITVENSNDFTYNVKVNMIECTEIIDDKDIDSSYMYLIGGHMGLLKPRCFKNITMLYPNMYIHNRRGFCLISLKFKNENDKIVQKKTNISFDTYLSKKHTTIMQDFYNIGELRTCSSIDLDPLNKCKPVDCHMKYLGARNYYNKRWKRCQKVPICVADENKEMPDVIYSPSNNKCKDMEKPITKSDLLQIESGTNHGPCEEKYQTLLNIDCHFGKLNNETGLCECDLGWISTPIDKDQSDTWNLFVYHMCNIEIGAWYDSSSRLIKFSAVIIGILAVIIAMFVIICAFLINQCYNCIKSFEKRGTSKHKLKRSRSKSSPRIKKKIRTKSVTTVGEQSTTTTQTLKSTISTKDSTHSTQSVKPISTTPTPTTTTTHPQQNSPNTTPTNTTTRSEKLQSSHSSNTSHTTV